MRTRKIGHREERLSACENIKVDSLCEKPEPIDIKSIFPDFSHFRLEIGCGKGGYVCGEAKNHIDTAYFAVELMTDVIVQAAEKAKSENCKNVIFINTDASRLPELFSPESFEVIHINFCDPWPKKRHAKRRLTNRKFLSAFGVLLTKGGHIAFKTDNAALFEYSLPEFEAAGFDVRDVTRDLHKSDFAGCDTETEYEKAFSAKGTPICRLTAYPEK